MISWSSYVQVRKVNVRKWLSHNNVVSYDDFVKLCQSRGVNPPPVDVYNSYVSNVTTGVSNQPEPPEEAKDTPADPGPDTIENDTSPAPSELGVYDVDESGFLVAKTSGEDEEE